MAEGTRRFSALPNPVLEDKPRSLALGQPSQPRTPGVVPSNPRTPGVVPTDPNETDLSESVLSGIEQVIGSAQGAVAAGAAAVGAEEFAIRQAQNAAESMQRANELAPPIRDIRDVDPRDPSSVYNYMTGLFGTQAPVMASLAIGGPTALGARALAAKAGSKFAGRLSTRAALATGIVGSGSTLETGAIFNAALQEPNDGKTLGEIGRASLVGGVAAGSLEAIPLIQAADRLGLGKKARNALQRSLGSRVARGTAAQALSEGATEAAQTIIERSTLKFLNENGEFDVFSDEGYGEILNATAAGAILGGGFGALTSIPKGKSDLDARMDRLEEEEENREAEARSGLAVLRSVPGFEEEADILESTFSDPDTQDEIIRRSRRFGKVKDHGTLVGDILKRNAVDASKVTPLHVEAIRKVADGDVELTPEIREALEPLFPTLSDGSSVLDVLVESIATRLGTKFELGEGEIQFDLSEGIGESIFEVGDEFADGAVEVDGETLPAAERVGKVGESKLERDVTGTLKREFQNRPDLPTHTEKRAAKINANRRNNLKASLVDLFDVIRESKERAGLTGGRLQAAMNNAARAHLDELIANEADPVAQDRLIELFESEQQPSEFLKKFELIAQEKAPSGIETGPVDFDTRDLKKIVVADHGSKEEGQILGDSDIPIHKSRKVIKAIELTKSVMRKVGINELNPTLDEIATSFFDGLTGLRLPPIFDNETTSDQDKAAIAPAKGVSGINPDTVVFVRDDGSNVTYGEISATPQGKARARVENLAADKTRLPEQIAELEELDELNAKQRERLARLKTRLENLEEDIALANNKISDLTSAIEVNELAGRLKSGEETEREITGTVELSAAEQAAAEDGGPVINPNDIPVADRARVNRGDVEASITAAINAAATEQRQEILPAEQAFVKELSKIFGFDINIKRTPLKEHGIDLGFADPRTNTVYIDSAIKSPALRIEVIAHEVGHLLYERLQQTVLSAKETELQAAMIKEFEAWRSRARRGTFSGVVRSKESFVTAMEVLGSNPTIRVADMSKKDRDYLLDFHEWFASQTARWATTAAEPKGIIEELFDKFAKTLKRIFGKAKKFGYTPSGTFEAFLNEVMLTKVSRRQLKAIVLDEAGQRLPPSLRKSRRVIVGSALMESSIFSEEANDYIRGVLNSKELTAEELGIVLNAFDRGSVRRVLLAKLAAYPALREEAKNDNLAAAAYGYQLWASGELKLGPQTEGVMSSLAQLSIDTMGFVREHKQAEDILTAIRSGVVEARILSDNSQFGIEKHVQKTQFQKVVKEIVSVSKTAQPLMQSIFSSAASRIRSYNNAPLRKLVSLYYNAPGDEFNTAAYFESRTRNIGRLQNISARAIGKLDANQLSDVIDSLQDPKKIPRDKESKEALGQIRLMFRETLEYARDAGLKIGDRGTRMPDGTINYSPRVWDAHILQKRKDAFMQMLLQPKYEKELQRLSRERGYFDEDGEFIVTKVRLSNTELAEVIFDTLITNDGSGDVDLNPDKDSHIPFAPAVNQRVLSFLSDEDTAQFLSRDLKSNLIAYTTQVVKRAEFVKRFGDEGQEIGKLLAQAKQAGATEDQLNAAQAFVDAMQGTYGTDFDENFRAVIDKMREFVIKGGSIDKMLEELSKLEVAKFNSIMITWQNIRLLALATMTSFVDVMGPAMRGDLRSAWTGYSEGFDAFLSTFKNLKGKDRNDLVELAEALGIINENLTNQALAWEYGTLHMSRQARKINDGFFKYTGLNGWTKMTRLMATSSAQAWLSRQARSPTKETERWLAELDLVADDIVLTEAGRIKILTRQERRALRNEGSQVREVGDGALESVVDAKAELERDDRIRNALVRWVDGAILRPNAAQRPIWASAPAWQLTFHLKGFMYAAHETWVKRAFNELGNDNVMPMIYLMGMVPIMAASDWFRDRVQTGFNGPRKYKEKWDFTDHTWNAMQRAGVFGLGQLFLDMEKDARYNGLLSITDFGSPTADQIDLMLDIVGNNDKKRYTAFLKSLPAQNAWRNWPLTDFDISDLRADQFTRADKLLE